jgi:hypothetical protein
MNPNALLLALLLASNAGASVAQDLRIGSDVVTGARLLDLSSVTPATDILRSVALVIRDTVLEAKLNDDVQILLPHITGELVTPENHAGYLLRVNLYVNEFGAPAIPGGQLLSLIGPGADPVSALARYFSRDRLEAVPPSGLINSSSYLWISSRNGRLSASTIPTEFRVNLEQRAIDQSDRSRLDHALGSALGASHETSFSSAKYWIEVQKSRQESLRAARFERQMAEMTARLAEFEARANEISEKYRETEKEIAYHARRRQALETLQLVNSAVGSSLSSGALSKADGKAVSSGSGATIPFRSVEAEIKYTSEVLDSERGTLAKYEQSLTIYRTDIKKLQEDMGGHYKAKGISLPPRP